MKTIPRKRGEKLRDAISRRTTNQRETILRFHGGRVPQTCARDVRVTAEGQQAEKTQFPSRGNHTFPHKKGQHFDPLEQEEASLPVCTHFGIDPAVPGYERAAVYRRNADGTMELIQGEGLHNRKHTD